MSVVGSMSLSKDGSKEEFRDMKDAFTDKGSFQDRQGAASKCMNLSVQKCRPHAACCKQQHASQLLTLFVGMVQPSLGMRLLSITACDGTVNVLGTESPCSSWGGMR